MVKNNEKCNAKGQCCKCWPYGLLFLFLSCFCLAGIFCYMRCTGGTHSDLTAKVVKNIREGLDVPSSFKLIKAEQPDSAFGVYYFTEEEQDAISESLTDFSMTMLDNVSTLFDDSLAYDSENESQVMVRVFAPILQKASVVLMEMKDKGAFSGWKVKVSYSFADSSGHRWELTRWTFLNPEGDRILGKIDVPGIVECIPEEPLY